MKKYNKKYDTKANENEAMTNWLEHKRYIDEHNKKYREGKVSHKMKLMEHSNLSDDEIKDALTGVVHPEDSMRRLHRDNDMDFPAGPRAVDWRRQNLVAPAQKQSMYSCDGKFRNNNDNSFFCP